jgi:hypothetical protein
MRIGAVRWKTTLNSMEMLANKHQTIKGLLRLREPFFYFNVFPPFKSSVLIAFHWKVVCTRHQHKLRLSHC